MTKKTGADFSSEAGEGMGLGRLVLPPWIVI